jgi:hypothetical protein
MDVQVLPFRHQSILEAYKSAITGPPDDTARKADYREYEARMWAESVLQERLRFCNVPQECQAAVRYILYLEGKKQQKLKSLR